MKTKGGGKGRGEGRGGEGVEGKRGGGGIKLYLASVAYKAQEWTGQ